MKPSTVSIKDGVDLKLHVDYSFKPIISAQDSPLVKTTKAIADANSAIHRPQVIHGATDASNLQINESVPRHRLRCAVSGTTPTPNESVDLDEFRHVQRVYEQLVKQVLA